MVKKVIIADLDGTLALIDHRKPFIDGSNGKKPDWNAFNRAVFEDLPNKPIINLLKVFRSTGTHEIYIYTGRDDSAKTDTLKWLTKYGIEYDKLRMRPAGLNISDTDLKWRWIEWDFPSSNDKDRIEFVIDDRDKVVKMWRNNGLTCLQVAFGDF